MSIGAALYKRVSEASAIVAAGITSISPGFAPPTAPGTYITYLQVSGPRAHSLAGAQGLVHSRWQFNLWATNTTTLDTIADALRTSLDGYSGTPAGQTKIQGAFLVDERETPNSSPEADADRVYGIQQDYMVHAEESY